MGLSVIPMWRLVGSVIQGVVHLRVVHLVVPACYLAVVVWYFCVARSLAFPTLYPMTGRAIRSSAPPSATSSLKPSLRQPSRLSGVCHVETGRSSWSRTGIDRPAMVYEVRVTACVLCITRGHRWCTLIPAGRGRSCYAGPPVLHMRRGDSSARVGLRSREMVELVAVAS